MISIQKNNHKSIIKGLSKKKKSFAHTMLSFVVNLSVSMNHGKLQTQRCTAEL